MQIVAFTDRVTGWLRRLGRYPGLHLTMTSDPSHAVDLVTRGPIDVSIIVEEAGHRSVTEQFATAFAVHAPRTMSVLATERDVAVSSYFCTFSPADEPDPAWFIRTQRRRFDAALAGRSALGSFRAPCSTDGTLAPTQPMAAMTMVQDHRGEMACGGVEMGSCAPRHRTGSPVSSGQR